MTLTPEKIETDIRRDRVVFWLALLVAPAAYVVTMAAIAGVL